MSATASSRRVCLAWAAAATALALAGQFLTVRFNYHGNWTGLFCTGSRLPVPPALSHERIHVFADSSGYDGQFYHYIAHDPFFNRGFASYIDAPRLRYRRILVPFLAWLLSGGGGAWLHAAYVGVNLAFVFLGSYWLACCLAHRGLHPAWGLSFLAIPGVIISLDRLVLDGPLTALAAGFVWYAGLGKRGPLLAVLTAAPLVRETGLLLTAAATLPAAWARRWRQALLYAITACPALAWYAWVHSRTVGSPPIPQPLTLPLAGLFERIFQSPDYPFPTPVSVLAATLDWIAIAGVLLTLALAVGALLRRHDPPAAVLASYALLIAALRVHFWIDAYSHTRLISPLLVLLLAGEAAIDRRGPWLALCLMLPRVGLQLGSQALGVLRGLVG